MLVTVFCDVTPTISIDGHHGTVKWVGVMVFIPVEHNPCSITLAFQKKTQSFYLHSDAVYLIKKLLMY